MTHGGVVSSRVAREDTSEAFAPYLPRLVQGWDQDNSRQPFRELDGSLVSVDISGFTSLSERLAARGRLGVEELILLLSGCFEGLIGIARRYGGDVLKFRGDALLLLFSDAEHERRACSAASEMQWFIERTRPMMSSVGPVELRMATGVYSGTCQFFLVDMSHRELIVAGPAATATAELEDAAGPDEILIGTRTAEAVGPGATIGKHNGGYILERREPETAGHVDWTEELVQVSGLDAFVPASLRAHLAVASGEAEHRLVTVAFLKLSDTDGIVERGGPEALADRLQALGAVVDHECTRYGVTWLESDIDGGGIKLYLTAGAPASTGSDEEAMLRALRAVLDADLDLPLQAGVNRGHVFAGDVGATARRTYAVMGDAVNLAARLCARAELGQILATGDVLDRSAARFETERRPFLLKGKERSVMAYRVGALTGVRAEEAGRLLPLVGRAAELEALGEAVAAARTMQSRLVELIGEPGIGKSRLVEELKTLSFGFNQLVSACERYSQSEPFSAWRNVLRRLAGITPEQSRIEAGEQLEPWIQTVMPDLAPWLPLLAIPFDAEVAPTPEADSIDETFRFQRLNDTVEQFLQRALVTPTLLIFEDAHWMDDASRFVLEQIAGSPAPRPWLVCVTRRPEGASLRGEDAHRLQLVLDPLSEADAAALTLASLEDEPLPEETLATLAERSGGNPLFIRELVAASRHGASLDALPQTVETLLTTRIDTLDPADRMLLRYASVIGPTFDLALIGEILADELPDAGELGHWERLTEFVTWAGPETLSFRHDLIRATAYEGLSFRRRRVIHGRVGEALESRAGERADEAPALLSLHFLEAEEYGKAWRYAVLAGDQARAKYANVVAGELYERALAAAEHLELERVDVARVAEALGDVAERFGDYAKSGAAYAQARTEALGDGEAQTRLLLKEGVLRERSGSYDDALLVYERALTDLDSFGLEPRTEAGLRAQLELAYAGVRHRQGNFAEAADWARKATTHAEEGADTRELAHAYYLLDIALTRLGRPDPSYRDRALPMLEKVGDLVGLATALNNLGVNAYFAGRWEESLAAYRRSGELSRKAGDVVSGARGTNNEAEILSDQGHLEEASERFEEALRVWRAARYPVGVALATSNLGRVAARAGRFEAAYPLFVQAQVEFERIGADAFTQETRFRIAECFVFEGRYKQALELAAVTLAAAGGAEPSVVSAALERLLGYAAVQARRPEEESAPHFARSLEQARALGAEYEAALTLKAIAETDSSGAPEARAESARILASLGVVSTPSVPLP
jgi:class 3 adenylate cyclase/tetratricopeptide (TPR) repeat protein